MRTPDNSSDNVGSSICMVITPRDEMPLNCNLQVKIFDVWGINFMGPFPKSKDCEYFLSLLTMCPSGWKHYHAEQSMPSKHARCSAKSSSLALELPGWS
jgi:hypothetical protein